MGWTTSFVDRNIGEEEWGWKVKKVGKKTKGECGVTTEETGRDWPVEE